MLQDHLPRIDTAAPCSLKGDEVEQGYLNVQACEAHTLTALRELLTDTPIDDLPAVQS